MQLPPFDEKNEEIAKTASHLRELADMIERGQVMIVNMTIKSENRNFKVLSETTEITILKARGE
ncbi:putative DNA-binding protein [Escherichia phage JakobBernoulli]|uniref:DNA-binding protein n=1 Tax=Escherichia phage JakobBernoulli TaxID=2851971 RepID=A0AAE7VU47_9CAUD|nr:putative DNA-binding protein [Escherichia phage JakobBernoulli]